MKSAWLLLLLLLPGCVLAPADRSTIFEATKEFDVVCRHMQAELDVMCGRDLRPPVVVVTGLMKYMGLLGGYYSHDEVIFVGRQEDMKNSQTEVIIHETVHYVLIRSGFQHSRCVGEAYARRWTAEILGEEEDPTWKERYGCVRSL